MRSARSSQDCVGSGAGDDKGGEREQIGKFLIGILKLGITGDGIQGSVHISLAAQVNDIVIFNQFRKQIPDGGIDGTGAAASADDQKCWLCGICKITECKSAAGIS